MTMTTLLEIAMELPIKVQNAGLCISRGQGLHPRRIIDSYEFIFVRSGTLHIEEEERSFAVHTNQTLLLWPHRLHQGSAHYDPDLSFFWLHFTLNQPHLPQTAEPLRIAQLTTLSRPDYVHSLFRRFLDDQQSKELSATEASLLVLLMFCEVIREEQHEESTKTAALLAHRVEEYIRLHFHEPISTSSIAAELYSNPDYLGRVYHHISGYTITEAIHRRRLHHARKLLLDSRQNIEQIAHSCGFEDAGYFRRIFKRSEGMSPLAFRRLHARIHVNTE